MPHAVNVICTFLDAGDTLGATLESLRVQRTDEARFILIDDGSSDSSRAIAESFCSSDLRFICQGNPVPGRGRALNLGIAMTDAEYVAILDADDIAHPAWLDDGLTILRRHGELAVMGFERIYIRDGDEAIWTPAGESPGPDVRNVTRGLARANVLAHSGTIMRKGPLAGVGGYDASRRRLFDYDLWIRLAQDGQQLGVSRLVRIAKRYHGGQKFAHSRGYDLAAWREQLRAIMAIDRDYRNFLRLGRRIAGDISRRPRRALAAGMRRR
jgi:glycosyltransferase involved in cell wall biosynthesis